MNLATSISPYLPFLRRYSRALNGSQESGDAYVAAALEVLVDDPSSFDTTLDSRVALYRMFSRFWESDSRNRKVAPVNSGVSTSASKWEALAQHRISTIPPRARQTFLLMSVEGFSAQAIATILDQDAKAVVSLIDEAAKTIADQVATNVMIIEDEPLIALDLKSIMESLGHIVTGIARTHRDAATLALRKPPGLILADIKLADGSSGIDAVNHILHSFELPVIFITAFPERLLTGERPEPAFLITKPFTPEVVTAMVSQALFFNTTAKAAA